MRHVSRVVRRAALQMRHPATMPILARQIASASSTSYAIMPTGTLVNDSFEFDPLTEVATQDILEDLSAAEVTERKGKITIHSKTFDPSEAMLSLLTRGRNDPFLIPPLILYQLAQYAHQLRFTSMFTLIANYSIERIKAEKQAHTELSNDTTKLLCTLFDLASHDVQLKIDIMLPLIELVFVDGPTQLSAEYRHSLMQRLEPVSLMGICRVLSQHADLPRFLPILNELVPAILAIGRSHPANETGQNSAVGAWRMYDLLLAMITHGLRTRALELFSQLMKEGRFPHEVTLGMDIMNSAEFNEVPTGFDALMIMCIARACQVYGWPKRNMLVIQRLVATCDESASEAHTDVASRVLHTTLMDLISEGTEPSLLNATTLFRACIDNPYVEPPPDRILGKLYDALDESGMHLELFRVFNVVESRTQPVESLSPPAQLDAGTGRRYDLPPYGVPAGRASLSLINYILRVLKNPRHLERIAAYHAAHPHELGAQQHQIVPEILTVYAEAGRVIEATQIWRALKSERGGEMIVGSAASTLAMVKALLYPGNTKRSPRTRRHDARSKAQVVPGDSFAAEEFDDATPFPVDNIHDNHLSQQNRRALAEEIAAAFITLHQPLQLAPHATLTAIANVNFLIGNLSEALAPLSVMLDRRTIPDGHDFLVTVSGLTQYDPSKAVTFLEQATAEGVEVPKQAWLVVLKEVLLDEDYEAAYALLRNMERTGIETDAAMLDTVLRYGMNFTGGGNPAEVQLFFERALVAISRQSDPTSMPSLAKKCIQRALKAGVPDVAFLLWDALLREKSQTAAGNKELSNRDWPLRNLIAQSLARRYAEGKAEYTLMEGESMCGTLGAKSMWHKSLQKRTGKART